MTSSFAHLRLVLLYARMGRTADAERHWKIFSETFTHPDPDRRTWLNRPEWRLSPRVGWRVR